MEKPEKRTLEQLIEMVLFERLDSVLEDMDKGTDNQAAEQGEAVINALGEEQKTAIQEYMNDILDHESQSNEKAYLGGFHDAIGLVVRLALMALHYDK